jgi:hypothetical protein
MLNPPVLVPPPSKHFGELAPSDIAKPPESNASKPYSMGEQISNEQCPQSKKLTNIILVFDLTHLIFFGHG